MRRRRSTSHTTPSLRGRPSAASSICCFSPTRRPCGTGRRSGRAGSRPISRASSRSRCSRRLPPSQTTSASLPRRPRLTTSPCTSRASSPRSITSAAGARAGISSPPPIPRKRSISARKRTSRMTTAMTARRNLPRSCAACGTAGTRTRSFATKIPAAISIRRGCTCSITRASISPCAGRSMCRARRRGIR
jgi:hypothetical protein